MNATAPTAPTITLISTVEVGGVVRRRYLVEGGKLCDGWGTRAGRTRAGRIPRCEIALYGDDDRLASYGGEVWPSAWPSLFERCPATAQSGSGGMRLTDEGRAAIRAA